MPIAAIVLPKSWTLCGLNSVHGANHKGMIGGIVFSALAAQLLMNQGFQYCKSWEGGLILTSEVVFTSLLGILVLGEIFSWRFGCGGLLIVASAIFSNFANNHNLSVRPENSSL